DGHVTGVQTCALPIFLIQQRLRSPLRPARIKMDKMHRDAQRNRDDAKCSEASEDVHPPAVAPTDVVTDAADAADEQKYSDRHARSEERRVGKEWRSRW